MTDLRGKKVIIRGIQSGDYYGTLVDINGQEVEMTDCRNIWKWYGANNLTELADKGIVESNENRITKPVECVIFTDICEIVPCSEQCINTIEECSIWEFQE